MLAVGAGFKTRAQVIRERGGNPQDVFEQIKQEKSQEKEAGIIFNTSNSKPKENEDAKDTSAEENDEDEGKSGADSSEVLQNLQQKHGKPSIRCWFGNTTITKINNHHAGKIVTLECPRKFIKDWFEQHFLADINRFWAEQNQQIKIGRAHV